MKSHHRKETTRLALEPVRHADLRRRLQVLGAELTLALVSKPSRAPREEGPLEPRWISTRAFTDLVRPFLCLN